MTTLLTPHFSLEELGGVGPIAPAHRLNLGRLAVLLESFRKAAGVPLIVTNAYRAPEKNELVGGVPNSQHLDGSAADVIPKGISHWEFNSRIERAAGRGQLGEYGQLIYYPFSLVGASWGHIHISLGNRDKRGERLVRINEFAAARGRKYAALTPSLLSHFPRPGGGTVVIALLGAVTLYWMFTEMLHPFTPRG